MVWLLALLVKVAITLLLTVAVAGAQDRRQNEPGQFDFYRPDAGAAADFP